MSPAERVNEFAALKYSREQSSDILRPTLDFPWTTMVADRPLELKGAFFASIKIAAGSLLGDGLMMGYVENAITPSR